jgi:hypothetical protein
MACYILEINNTCFENWYYQIKYFFLNKKATLTKPIITGNSTSVPMTAAKASPELIPKIAIASAIANSKLLLAAVNDKVVAYSYVAPILLLKRNEITNITIK